MINLKNHNKKEKQDANTASCSKDFRRLFNKKVFTDTVVINALVALHSVQTILVSSKLIPVQAVDQMANLVNRLT